MHSVGSNGSQPYRRAAADHEAWVGFAFPALRPIGTRGVFICAFVCTEHLPCRTLDLWNVAVRSNEKTRAL